MLRYASRKFLLCLVTLVSSSWLVSEKVINSGDYKSILIGVIGAYIVGNVAQKATVKSESAAS